MEDLASLGTVRVHHYEMRAIRDEYQRLEREPTDIELETLAQTWSEHCVHKTLKSKVEYDPGRFLTRVTQPVLIVGGALDPVLPPHRHHSPLVAGMASTDVRAEVVPGVNHLLLPARTSSPTEYVAIRQPSDPRVLALVTGWLAERGLGRTPGSRTPGRSTSDGGSPLS